MAEPERAPHSSSSSYPTASNSITTLPPDHLFSSGTYVVQIPKDQIYRIPPPENALIVERHRNPSTSSSSERRSCCLRFFLPLFLLLLIIVLLALLLPPLLASPKPPIFQLTNFKLVPSTRDFHIDLILRNPNSVGSIAFQQPARASLSFRKKQLAAGKFPLIRQPQGSSRHVALALHAKTSALPKEMEKRLKNDKSSSSKLHVSLSLKMNLPAEFRGRFSRRRNVRFVVVCGFTLGKRSQILSQQCQSQLQ